MRGTERVAFKRQELADIRAIQCADLVTRAVAAERSRITRAVWKLHGLTERQRAGLLAIVEGAA
jgi:hypothetical protein